MNKKVIVFILVLVGLGGFVWWKTSAPQSAQDRLAQAMHIMQGLESRAIPVALTNDQLTLLEQVYQDSLERIPNIQGFRDADKTKLIDTLKTSNFGGTGTNGLNTTGEKILSMSLARTDDFNTYFTSGFTSDVGIVTTKDQIKKLAQSVNTLTNDIRLTTLYVSWYEGIRGKICTTNDPNNDIYVSGEVKMLYSPSTSLQDTCGNNEVKQFKCINGLYEDDAAHVSKTQCPNGCNGGVCLKEAAAADLSVDMPTTAAVGASVQVRVSASTTYTQPFFIIVAGDDDAVFPTGALRIMSGEVSNNMVSKNFEIKFSKAGTMTVTIRPKEGAEVSKTIVVGGASTAQCGNGVREGDEQCDDGNTKNEDGCSSTCSQENAAYYFQAANKLASLGIIDDFSAKPIEYRLADSLIRYDAVRTEAKALGGILENESSYTCIGTFSDIGKTVPTCRVAELAQKAGLIGTSSVFRPNDKLSKLEAMSFALKSAGLMPSNSLSMNQIIELALSNKLIPNTANFNPAAIATRGEFFYWVSQALDANNTANICDIAPDLCGGNNAKCGNGIKEGSEECDDGNTNDSDACTNTCKNKAIASTCIDSDGTDYFKKGVVKSASVEPQYDSCDNQDTLSERVCRPYNWHEGAGSCSRPDGCIDIIKYKCPNGCNDGACKGGIVIGLASIDVSAPSEVATNESFDMTVRILDSSGHKITNYEGTIYFDNATGPVANVSLPSFGDEGYKFTLSDQGEHVFSKGFNIKKPGSYQIEVYEIGTAGDGITKRVNIKAVDRVAACTDTDGGMNIFAKGTATNNAAVIPAGRTKTATDVCTKQVGQSFQEVTSCTGTGCYVDEAVCLTGGAEAGLVGKGGSGQADHKCPNGCMNGACVPTSSTTITTNTTVGPGVNPSTSCVDTDGGLFPKLKGTVSGISYFGESYTYTDLCNKDADGKEWISEAYCYAYPEGGAKIFWAAERRDCANGCMNGACK